MARVTGATAQRSTTGGGGTAGGAGAGGDIESSHHNGPASTAPYTRVRDKAQVKDDALAVLAIHGHQTIPRVSWTAGQAAQAAQEEGMARNARTFIIADCSSCRAGYQHRYGARFGDVQHVRTTLTTLLASQRHKIKDLIVP